MWRCSSPLFGDVMSSTTILDPCLRFAEQTCCCLAVLFLLVLPDVVHLLHLQHLHYEKHDELHTAGMEQSKTGLKSCCYGQAEGSGLMVGVVLTRNQ